MAAAHHGAAAGPNSPLPGPAELRDRAGQAQGKAPPKSVCGGVSLVPLQRPLSPGGAPPQVLQNDVLSRSRTVQSVTEAGEGLLLSSRADSEDGLRGSLQHLRQSWDFVLAETARRQLELENNLSQVTQSRGSSKGQAPPHLPSHHCQDRAVPTHTSPAITGAMTFAPPTPTAALEVLLPWEPGWPPPSAVSPQTIN